MTAEVLVELKTQGIDKTFTYKIPTNMEVNVGIRVLVPFGYQKLEGFVLEINNNKKCDYKIKDIIEIIDEKPVLNEEMLKIGTYMSKKTLCNLISCYQTMLPKALKAKHGTIINKKYISYLVINVDDVDKYIKTEKQKQIIELFKEKEVLKSEATSISLYTVKSLIEKGVLKEIKKETYRLKHKYNSIDKKIVLTEQQINAITNVKQSLDTFQPFLLHGVTGSGKTEVYMNLIEEVLTNNKKAIVLVPEISLTPQLINIFRSRFGEVACLHSGLSDGEKYDEWRKILNNEVSIVIGARSAIFAPIDNLGIIIIDEENTDSYKQENNPKYSAVDIALYRSKYHNCPIILGSATPSIESYTRAKVGTYKLIEMPNRVNNNLPLVYLIDMKEELKKRNRYFSDILKNKIGETLKKGEQVILLLNRRGFSTVLTCHDCGHVDKCPNCDIPLTYHKSSNKMMCHYCNYSAYKLSKCPKCGSSNINEFGMGTQKLEEEVINHFNDSKVIRMDIDTTRKKGAHEKIIEDFKNEKYNILIGTQMIAKGLDFPKVTLVGVLNGDAGLNIPDFRSAERTFSLLDQVAGRAGRSSYKGEVVIQGFNINHYSIIKAKQHDYIGFYNEEINIRRKLGYPPFNNLCLLKVESKDYNLVIDESKKISSYLKDNLKELVLGPSMASVPKVNNVYYMQIIIKYKKTENIMDSLITVKDKYKTNNKVNVEIDINPLKI